MARAGFWAIGGGPIVFGKDGDWYADGERIPNPRIARLFSSHIQSDGKGGWVVDVGIDRQPVQVEDTPLVVRSVDGDPERGFTIRTSDDVTEPLACETLRIGRGDVLYCEVDRGARGRMPARFLRPAYYHLVRHAEEAKHEMILPSQGRRYRLRARAA